MNSLSSRQLIFAATAATIVIVLGAWTFEALGYAPCKLCYWQRYPHYAAVGIGLLALLLRAPRLAWAGALALAATSAVGVYHSGVERKLWAGPTSCTGGGVEGLSAEELMNQIMSAPLIRCDEIPWEMFGVTMANLNAVGSAGLVLVWILAARRA